MRVPRVLHRVLILILSRLPSNEGREVIWPLRSSIFYVALTVEVIAALLHILLLDLRLQRNPGHLNTRKLLSEGLVLVTSLVVRVASLIHLVFLLLILFPADTLDRCRLTILSKL